MGNWFSDKYAEGTIGRRFYAGCRNVDTVEALAAEHAGALFGAEHAYARPHSGIDANLVAFWAVLAQRVEAPALEKAGVCQVNDLSEADSGPRLTPPWGHVALTKPPFCPQHAGKDQHESRDAVIVWALPLSPIRLLGSGLSTPRGPSDMGRKRLRRGASAPTSLRAFGTDVIGVLLGDQGEPLSDRTPCCSNTRLRSGSVQCLFDPER